MYKWKSCKYNRDSLPIIEQYGKENGYNFQHAERGGEYQIPKTRYYVDGYDNDKNVVIEYDEKHHYKDGKLRNEDMERQQKIMEIMKSRFIRIRYDGEIVIYE